MQTIHELKCAITAFTRDFGELPEFPLPYGKPTILPREKHPRVWINASKLERTRANMRHPENKYNLDKITAKADKDFDGKLPPRGEGRQNFTLESISDIECMAYMYLMTGDQAYGYKTILAALNWLDTIDFDKPKDSEEHYYMSNSSGYSIHVMAEVYDWCYDLLTDKEKTQLAVGTANRLGPNLEVHYPPNGLGGITGHGTSAQILRDWLSFSIAAYDEFPQFYNNVLGRIQGEYIEAPNFYYPSGANFQGSAYGINKTYLHMVSELLVENMSGEKLYAPDVSFEATVETFMQYHRPDDESLRIGDDYNQRGPRYSHYDSIRLAFFGGIYYNNAALKAWSRAMSEDFTKLVWSGRCEITPLVFVLLNNPELGHSEADKYSLPLINYNGSPMGVTIARSAWGDPDAWMTYSKVGEIYGANHDHKDAGSFQIFYKGILAMTSSCYQYRGRDPYGSPMDLGYNKQSISKNCLLIYNPNLPDDGKWLNSGGQRWRGKINWENNTLSEWMAKTSSHQAKILAHGSRMQNGTVEYAYIAGDLTNAYDEETVQSVTRHTISIATEDAAHPLMFAVYDRITSRDAAFKKKFLLHMPEEPSIDGNVVTITNTERGNNGKLVSTTLLPCDAEYTVIGGDGKRFWVNGVNLLTENIEGEPVGRDEVGWGRVEISPAAENCTDAFLHVMYVGDADRTEAVIPASHIISDTHDGSLSMGIAVLFPKSTDRVSGKVQFTTAGEGIIRYYVLGLADGAWSFCADGNTLGTKTVSSEEGVLSFTAPAGSVTITLQ